ncbi:MAG TPA: PAS domain-containing sensor histidine kinase [Flavipsychrobacter sp.]|nr:PAS domain-containing sensor histidine kinase [Flavipsychrobacter sp.]
MNKLLQRQVGKYLSKQADIPADIEKLLSVISESYDHYEKDRLMLERSIELSSGEMIELNNDLRREAEVSNRAHRELRTLFDNMQDVFFSIDMERYKVVQMSPACRKVYGYEVEDFFNDPELWSKVIIEDDRLTIFGNQPVLDRGETLIQQYRIKHKNGQVRWVESRLQPTLSDGKLVRLDGLTTDITQRKEAELALQESESKFRFLIENSTDAIMVIDENATVSYASDSLYRIMGNSAEEVIGVRAYNFIYSEDVELLKAHMERVLAHPGLAFTVIYRRVRKDGSLIWCEGSATNLLHEKAIQGIVVNFRDITQRKLGEDALKASHDELKKSNSELDRFVYSVSHDLRAPLSSMLGVVEMSETETEDILMLKHLQMLKRSINRLDGFINDILDYSRNARGEVKCETVNFSELAKEVISNLKFMDAGNKVVEIKLDIDGDLEFQSDRSRVSILLNNLVSNAIRYSDPLRDNPYVAVSVSLRGEAIELEVKDNGLGISEENREKVFEMFYRVSKRSIGSGLGLYIVKETVEKLNGTIRLDSELNKGTTFKVALPRCNN